MTNSQADQSNQARTLLEQAKEVLIALPSNPTFDAVASTMSLYLGLSTRGTQVSVVCPDQMTVEFSHLVGVDKITNNISGSQGKNLIISFPYQEGSIEKVSYNIENDTFNLVIEPREGYPLITQDVVRFVNSGGNTDLIITVGAANLSDLSQIYNNNQNLFTEKPVINIDTNNQNMRYGRVNLVDPNLSCISELMISFFSNFGISLNADTATNLLAGMTQGTNNFTSSQVQASTYEASAMCLRSGARRIMSPAKLSTGENSFPKPVKPMTFGPTQPNAQTYNKPFTGGKIQQPTSQPKPFQSQVSQQINQQPKKQTNEAPPDWLKPKIYKGSTLL